MIAAFANNSMLLINQKKTFIEAIYFVYFASYLLYFCFLFYAYV